MKCIICYKDDWENVDRFQLKENGLSICKGCGFVSYPEKYKKKEEVIEYYRKEYRNPPNAGNLFSGERKLNYHGLFLGRIFKEWKERKLLNPVVFDCGAAYGMFLHFVKMSVPGAELNGSELTTSFKRNAFHEFGIELVDDIDQSKKYDLISSYKVAEHQFDFDKELDIYHKCLKDDGYLYISVPTWFGEFSNFGVGGADLNYYYHPAHVNVWTERAFEYLLGRHGFKIELKDNIIYGSTYICKKASEDFKIPLLLDEVKCYPGKVKKAMEQIKKAFFAFNERKLEQAIAAYGNYPIAWESLYEKNKASLDKEGYEKIKEKFCNEMLKACGRTPHTLLLCANIALRYNNFKDSLEYADEVRKIKPTDIACLSVIAHSYKHMAEFEKNEEKKIEFNTKARDTFRMMLLYDKENFAQTISWIYKVNADIPTDKE